MRDSQQAVHLVATAVGFTSLTLLWLGLVLGIVLRDGRALDRIRPSTLAAVHQTVNACGLALVAVHGLTEIVLPGGGTDLVNALIPFTHRSHPVGVGLGVLGAELMIALALSVLLRHRIGYHRWRVVHRFGYLAFALVCAHVVTVGFDRRPVWLLSLLATIAVLTIGLGLATAGWVSRLPQRIAEILATRRRGERVAIHVDATRCVHFGFCQHEAPELFEVREDGRLEHAPSASVDQLDAAIRAARACPTRAILLSRQAVRVVLAEPPAEPVDRSGHGPGGARNGHSGTDGGRAEHVAA